MAIVQALVVAVFGHLHSWQPHFGQLAHFLVSVGAAQQEPAAAVEGMIASATVATPASINMWVIRMV